jgi:hypothetical protein
MGNGQPEKCCSGIFWCPDVGLTTRLRWRSFNLDNRMRKKKYTTGIFCESSNDGRKNTGAAFFEIVSGFVLLSVVRGAIKAAWGQRVNADRHA